MRGLWKFSSGGQGWSEPLEVTGQIDEGQIKIAFGDQSESGSLRLTGPGQGILACQDRYSHVSWFTDAQGTWVTLDGRTILFHQVPLSSNAQEEKGSLSSPMPAKVLEVFVKAGDTVEEGDLLLRLEAMKMEHTLKAPQAGQVKALHAQQGDQVDAGVLLVEME